MDLYRAKAEEVAKKIEEQKREQKEMKQSMTERPIIQSVANVRGNVSQTVNVESDKLMQIIERQQNTIEMLLKMAVGN